MPITGFLHGTSLFYGLLHISALRFNFKKIHDTHLISFYLKPYEVIKHVPIEKVIVKEVPVPVYHHHEEPHVSVLALVISMKI